MAQYQTEAVVLSVRNWGEADKMLRLFSRDHGKITAAAFGARRPKSPLASGLQMFHTVELSLSTGERVDTVRGCRLVHRFPHLETDLAAMAYASFIAEVLLELMPDGAPQPEVYDWLPCVLAACGAKNPRIVALAAGFQLLDFAGMGLSFDACAVSGAAIEGDAFFSAAEGGEASVSGKPASSAFHPFRHRLGRASGFHREKKRRHGGRSPARRVFAGNLRPRAALAEIHPADGDVNFCLQSSFRLCYIEPANRGSSLTACVVRTGFAPAQSA